MNEELKENQLLVCVDLDRACARAGSADALRKGEERHSAQLRSATKPLPPKRAYNLEQVGRAGVVTQQPGDDTTEVVVQQVILILDLRRLLGPTPLSVSPTLAPLSPNSTEMGLPACPHPRCRTGVAPGPAGTACLTAQPADEVGNVSAADRSLPPPLRRGTEVVD
jgi:hypothetical protein